VVGDLVEAGAPRDTIEVKAEGRRLSDSRGHRFERALQFGARPLAVAQDEAERIAELRPVRDRDHAMIRTCAGDIAHIEIAAFDALRTAYERNPHEDERQCARKVVGQRTCGLSEDVPRAPGRRAREQCCRAPRSRDGSGRAVAHALAAPRLISNSPESSIPDTELELTTSPQN